MDLVRNGWLLGLGAFFITWTAVQAMMPSYVVFAKKKGWVRNNYRGQRVPYFSGVILAASVVIADALLSTFPHVQLMKSNVETEAFLLVVIGLTLLGLLDDRFGTRDTGGFRGHFTQMQKGRWTTGSIKAIGGGLIALMAAILLDGWPSLKLLNSEMMQVGGPLLMGAVLIALSANTVNLLDVRPGRAIKGSLILLLLGAGYLDYRHAWMFGIIVGILVGYILFDMRAESMLGDSGANMIGGMIGLLHVSVMPIWAQLFLVVSLGVLNLYAETHSISEMIYRTKWLKLLDNWGIRR